MRHWILSFACAGALVLAGLASEARGSVSADINLHIGDRPPPVVVFEREPDVILVPRTRVYYVGGLDYDLFRYGRYWYINEGGYWFRARSYRGPFRAVHWDNVPGAIVRVPSRYHRHPVHPHGGPPGQMKKRRVVDRDDVRIIRTYDDDRGKRRGKKH